MLNRSPKMYTTRMGSETSKHKLVTLDQVANVPPTLKQQTLIKGLLLAWFFTWSKHPIECRKLSLEWRKTKPYSKKMQVPEFTSAQLPAMFNTPHIYVRHFECMNTKLSKGSSQTLVCGSSDAWKKKKKRLQRQSHEECSQRNGRVPEQKKKESLKPWRRQKNFLQICFFCFYCF